MSTNTDLEELKRKIDILWKIANICPKCNSNRLILNSYVCPPMYECPACGDPPVTTSSCCVNNTEVERNIYNFYL